jgi:large subunit ribosomal protein L22
MEVIALSKNIRISAFKCRDIARNIQGMPAADALEHLKFLPQKAAKLIAKTLKSAIANAENNNNLDPAALRIKQAIIGEGITLKRYTPRARGSASAIRKRTSHIKITLTDEPAAPKKQKNAQKGNTLPAQNKKEKTSSKTNK